jgi:Cft2 family RNA processing exonuclease
MKLNYTNCFSIIDNNQKANVDQGKIGSQDDYNIITHAHSDHVSISNQKTFTTKETSALIGLQTSRELDYSFLNCAPQDLTDNIKVQALNAGHILGSKMFYFESKDNTVLYTGDFRARDSLLFSGALPRQADVLIMETTFGRKEFNFPDVEETYSDFAELLKKDISKNRLILIGAYTLGKTQELIKFVNQYLEETPLITNKAFEFSKVYENFEINLGKYDLLDHNIDSHNILIVPMNLITKDLIRSLEHQQNRKVSSYLTTGWKHYRSGKCIPISDHSDYKDLLEFVRVVNPKQVYTMHGFAEEFSKSITKELGIWSRPLKDLNQITITNFL